MSKEINITELRDIISSLDPETTDPKELNELQSLLDSYESTSKEYKILDFVPSEKQQLLEDAIHDRWQKKSDKKYFLCWGGNNFGKTAIGAYLCVKLALGSEICQKIGLRPIGTKKDIIIGTEDSGVAKNIRNYLLGEDSITKIPQEYIEKIKDPGDFLKEIILKNGSRIRVITYKSGQESWQGHNCDYLWCDEEPKNKEVFNEIYERSRSPKCEMVMTMTPTGHSQVINEKFLENPNTSWQEKKVWSLQVFGYLDNPYASGEHIGGMNEDEKKRRVQGSFAPPEGIVYREFKKEHIVPHTDPFRSKFIGYDAEYYIGIDPGNAHIFGISFLCRTSSYNPDIPDIWYQFDEMTFKGEPLVYIIEALQKKISLMGKPPKHIVIDSAMRQVAVDFKQAGIKCIPADKRSIGKNGEGNRIAGINLVNDLFYQGRLFISDKCSNTIREYRKHQYKGGENDTSVIKLDDDNLDASRYVISFVELFEKKKKYKKSFISKGSYGETYTQGY